MHQLERKFFASKFAGSRNLERSQKCRVIFRYYFETSTSEGNLNNLSLKNNRNIAFEGQIQSSRAVFVIKRK